MACVEEGILVVGLGCLDCLVKQCLDIGWKSILQRIEIVWEIALVEVEVGKRRANALQLLTDAAYGFHVHLKLDAETFCKQVDQFNCRCCRAAAEIPDVGIHDVDAMKHCHNY